jgi:hypothetical protein
VIVLVYLDERTTAMEGGRWYAHFLCVAACGSNHALLDREAVSRTEAVFETSAFVPEKSVRPPCDCASLFMMK